MIFLASRLSHADFKLTTIFYDILPLVWSCLSYFFVVRKLNHPWCIAKTIKVNRAYVRRVEG